MRITHSSRVFLILRPTLVTGENGFDGFLSAMNLDWTSPRENVRDCEIGVELAGRCCYMSFGGGAKSKTTERYIQNLIGRNSDGSWRPGPAHGAVVEHPTWTFLVTGAGRGFSHEQVRQRAGWAYSQLSTRYCDFERAEVEDGSWDPGFTVPPLAQLTDRTRERFEQMLSASQRMYSEVLGMVMDDLTKHEGFQASLAVYPARERERMLRKAARGAARDIMCTATEAIMVMSANARALWNVIGLRASEHAEGEIRSVYVQIARIMEQEFPSLFSGLVYRTIWDGSTVVDMPRGHI